MIDEIKAQELIAQGEGQHVELKREVPSKVRGLLDIWGDNEATVGREESLSPELPAAPDL